MKYIIIFMMLFSNRSFAYSDKAAHFLLSASIVYVISEATDDKYLGICAAVAIGLTKESTDKNPQIEDLQASFLGAITSSFLIWSF